MLSIASTRHALLLAICAGTRNERFNTFLNHLPFFLAFSLLPKLYRPSSYADPAVLKEEEASSHVQSSLSWPQFTDPWTKGEPSGFPWESWPIESSTPEVMGRVVMDCNSKERWSCACENEWSELTVSVDWRPKVGGSKKLRRNNRNNSTICQFFFASSFRQFDKARYINFLCDHCRSTSGCFRTVGGCMGDDCLHVSYHRRVGTTLQQKNSDIVLIWVQDEPIYQDHASSAHLGLFVPGPCQN